VSPIDGSVISIRQACVRSALMYVSTYGSFTVPFPVTSWMPQRRFSLALRPNFAMVVLKRAWQVAVTKETLCRSGGSKQSGSSMGRSRGMMRPLGGAA